MTSLRQRARRVLGPAVMPLAYTGFTLLVFWYLWTPIDGARRTFEWDPVHEYWGDLAFQLETLARGHLALWNPYDRAGFPLYGDPQPGMLYPPNWLFLLGGALTGSLAHVFMELKIVVHWIFGAVGMHLFLRRCRVPEPGCYLGGVLFAFASPPIRYLGNALNWTYAWIPWVLLAAAWFADAPDRRRGAVLGTAVAMTLLAGAPAMFLYMLVVALPFGVYRMWGRLRPHAGAIAAAGLVCALWVLPLVLSNLEQLPHSVRSARDLRFITETSFRPLHAINLLVPFLPVENIYYTLLALGCLGLIVAARPRSPATVFAIVAAVGLLLALGKYAGYLASVASAAPPFGLFRRAHRLLYITTAAIAAGAGLGMGYLMCVQDPDTRRALARRATWVCGVITGILGVALVVSVAVSEKHGTDEQDGLAWAAISAAAGTWLLRGLLLGSERRRRGYAWAAVVIFALDLWGANVRVQGPGLRHKPTLERDAILAELPGVLEGSCRIYDRGYIQFRPGARLGVRDLGGYEDDPLGLSRYRGFLDLVHRKPASMGHANVCFFLDGRRHPRLQQRQLKRRDKDIYEVPAVAPAVMYVPRPEVVAGQGEAFDALVKIEPGAGAVVEGALPEGALGPADGATAAGQLTVLEPNRVVAEIETPGPGLVVVAEAYYPSWEATVNGAPVDILPANGLFRGVPVTSAGTHRIEMRLAPVRFWAALPAYLAAWALLIWAVIAELGARRRARADARRGEG